jgi:hypothetical protein
MSRSLLIFAILYCLLLTAPYSKGSTPVITWQLDHAPEGKMLESRASAITEDGDLAVLALLRPLKRSNYEKENQGWIGLFTPTGNVKEQFSFVFRPGDTAVQDVDAFAPIGGGKFLVAGVAPDGQSQLVAFDNLGKKQLVRALGKKRLSFIKKLPSGDLVAGGRSERDLFAIRIRPNGNVLWEFSLDRGFDDVFLEAILRGENVLALAQSGQREKLFMRDAVTGVTLLTPGISAIPTPSFSIAGRAGAIVAANDGYAMLVDAGVGIEQKIRFIRLDAAFKTIHSTDLISVPISLDRARLTRRKDGRYLMVTMSGATMIWLELNDSGTILSRLESPPGHAYLHPEIVGTDDVYSVSTEVKAIPNFVGGQEFLHIIKFSFR